ncbi:proton channel OtopLc-like [Physella acuta]|uniref:proton channel OtopLc-like n=1 Tax=Physella acuta TaxID=109671 RepID=UPI0027DAE911|nr:proton channel OtopLc-like [Physella acuta]
MIRSHDRLAPLEETDSSSSASSSGNSGTQSAPGSRPNGTPGDQQTTMTSDLSRNHSSYTGLSTSGSGNAMRPNNSSHNFTNSGNHSGNIFPLTKPDSIPHTSIVSSSLPAPTSPLCPETAPLLPASPPASPDNAEVVKMKQEIDAMVAKNMSTPHSSLPDFNTLKSAMKHDDPKKGKRKLSLLNTVMRRVSIHRRESTPAGRIATFFFGATEDAMKEEESGEESKNEDTRDTDKSHDNGHFHGEKSPVEKRRAQVAVLKENLFLILTGLYGIVIVILGAVIPLTDIFMTNTYHAAFEVFYIYLYVVSIVFLVYVYAYLLRRNRLKTEFLTRTLSRSMSWTRSWAKSWAKADESAKSKLRKRMISLDMANHHTGTFYLRLGVLGFGIGSMIHSGLTFGSYFAGGDDESCTESALKAIEPLFHLVFTFFQLYFIFMNSKMCIHRYKTLGRFGLMHMCATNICVWFSSIVVETLHVIHEHEHHSHAQHAADHATDHVTDHATDHATDHGASHGDIGHKPVHYAVNTTVKAGRKLLAAVAASAAAHDANDTDPCRWSGMMNQAVEAAGPYLYPCTIEYSLMCAGILYIMWKNVGNKPRRPRQSELEEDDDEQRLHRMSVDCTSSSRGLFLGILLMVGTIISIIAFYMLVNKPELHSSAIILTHTSETFIYLVTLLAIILAAIKMKNLTFHNEHEADLEDILILISYTGLLAFIIFSLVASIMHDADTRSALTILSNVTMLIQSTAQTIFMLAGDRMTAANEIQESKKAGREFITFLLISNFAMWAVNTFETQTPHHNPIQVEFYGPVAWAIFTHISVPLGIYYRFHSTVCFSNIWKNAWKRRKHDHH